MAKLENLLPLIEKWEGGYVNDPQDLGGATNRGITIGTWKSVGHDKNGDGIMDENDVRLLTREDFITVLREYYWNRCQGDKIKSQAIANVLVDWVWLSGATGIRQVQCLLGVTTDGVVGEKTLEAINSASAKDLFYRIKSARKDYIERICEKRPANIRFRKGWLRRLEAIKWVTMLSLILLPMLSSCRSSANYASKETKETIARQMAGTKDAGQLEALAQNASSLQSLKTGEVLTVEAYQVEYDSLSPVRIRREARVRLTKQIDTLQEIKQEETVAQRAAFVEIAGEQEEHRTEKEIVEKSADAKNRVGRWWMLVGLLGLVVLWKRK